jgi:hypothetical protein
VKVQVTVSAGDNPTAAAGLPSLQLLAVKSHPAGVVPAATA